MTVSLIISMSLFDDEGCSKSFVKVNDDDDDGILTILLFIIISSTRFPQTLSSSIRFRRPYDSSSISIDSSSSIDIISIDSGGISIDDDCIIVLVL